MTSTRMSRMAKSRARQARAAGSWAFLQRYSFVLSDVFSRMRWVGIEPGGPRGE